MGEHPRHRVWMGGLFACVLLLSSPRMVVGYGGTEECKLASEVDPPVEISEATGFTGPDDPYKYVDAKRKSRCAIYDCSSPEREPVGTPEKCWPGSSFKEQCLASEGGDPKSIQNERKNSAGGNRCKRCQNKEAFWCDNYQFGGNLCGKSGGRLPIDKCRDMASDAYHTYRTPTSSDSEKFDEACAAMLAAHECFKPTVCKTVGVGMSDTKGIGSYWEDWSKCPGLETFYCEHFYANTGKLIKDCYVEDGVIKMRKKEEPKKEEPKKEEPAHRRRRSDPAHRRRRSDTDTNKKDDDKSKKADAANTDQASATVPRTAGASLLPLLMPAMIAMQIA